MTLKPLREQAVVVTGASSGIGREATLRDEDSVRCCEGDGMVASLDGVGCYDTRDVELGRRLGGLLAPADDKPRQFSRNGGTIWICA